MGRAATTLFCGLLAICVITSMAWAIDNPDAPDRGAAFTTHAADFHKSINAPENTTED